MKTFHVEPDVLDDDPWLLDVWRWMRGKRHFTAREVFEGALSIPWRNVDRAFVLRMAALLRKLGAIQSVKQLPGRKTRRCWVRVRTPDGERLGPADIEAELKPE